MRNPEVYITRGRLLAKLGYTKEGKRDIMRALEISPQMPEALVAMGEAEFQEKNYAKAVDYLDRALGQNPSFASGQYKLGMSHVFLERPQEGARHLQLAVKYGYSDPNAYRTLGYLYRQLGRRSEAVKAFEDFLSKALVEDIPQGTIKEVRRQLKEMGVD